LECHNVLLAQYLCTACDPLQITGDCKYAPVVTLQTGRKIIVTQHKSLAVFYDAAQLRAVLDSSVDGIITIDEQGLIESVNPAAERLFGYTASELIGRNVSLLMPAPYQSEHDNYLRNYLQTGIKTIIGSGREVQGLRKDGVSFPLYLAVSETDFGDRRIFTGSLHDLTALKDAEERATQVGYILEDSLNEIFIFDIRTHHFLHLNHGALRNIGYTTREIAKLTPADIMPEFTPEWFGNIVKPLGNATEPNVQFETIHQRKDGTTYDVMVRLHQAQWRGRRAYIAIILDITDRVERDTQLRIQNQAIQAAMEGIVIMDAVPSDCPIVFVNPAFEVLSGYSANQVIGRSCDLLCAGASDSPDFAALHQAMKAHCKFQTTIECTRKNGEVFWNDISIAPVSSSSGIVTHLVAVMEDVSDRRDAQQQLLQSERLAAIGEMVTGLAHESRNALQRAQACLDMLSLDLKDQPEQLELTEKTRRALRDLHRYYEEVRNYAAPIQLKQHEIDLRQLWRMIWRDLEAIRFGHNIELIEVVGGTNVSCLVDEHRIGQVFRNIMENAIAACHDSGTLTISCSDVTNRGKECLEIHFLDDGSGLNAQSASRIFQPFYTTKQKGTGLGMAIAKRIVEAHGGTVDAADATGAGADICVVLPRQLKE